MNLSSTRHDEANEDEGKDACRGSEHFNVGKLLNQTVMNGGDDIEPRPRGDTDHMAMGMGGGSPPPRTRPRRTSPSFNSNSNNVQGSCEDAPSLDLEIPTLDPSTGRRFTVDSMRWTDPEGDCGVYTGEVDALDTPNGWGTMKYDNGPVVEGRWSDGLVEVDGASSDDDEDDSEGGGRISTGGGGGDGGDGQEDQEEGSPPRRRERHHTGDQALSMITDAAKESFVSEAAAPAPTDVVVGGGGGSFSSLNRSLGRLSAASEVEMANVIGSYNGLAEADVFGVADGGASLDSGTGGATDGASDCDDGSQRRTAGRRLLTPPTDTGVGNDAGDGDGSLPRSRKRSYSPVNDDSIHSYYEDDPISEAPPQRSPDIRGSQYQRSHSTPDEDAARARQEAEKSWRSGTSTTSPVRGSWANGMALEEEEAHASMRGSNEAIRGSDPDFREGAVSIAAVSIQPPQVGHFDGIPEGDDEDISYEDRNSTGAVRGTYVTAPGSGSDNGSEEGGDPASSAMGNLDSSDIDKEFIKVVNQVEERRFGAKSLLGVTSPSSSTVDLEDHQGQESGKQRERPAWEDGSSFIIDKDRPHHYLDHGLAPVGEDTPVVNKSKRLTSTGGPGNKNCKRWCTLFVVFILLCVGAAAGVSWYLLVRRSEQNMEIIENIESSQNKSQTISWDKNTPCADLVIDVSTDIYGNETYWELFYSPPAVRQDAAIVRKRLRQPHRLADDRIQPRLVGGLDEIDVGKRRQLEGGLQLLLARRHGPYAYIDPSNHKPGEDNSGRHTLSVCLPHGSYKFVMFDAGENGICCEHGLGRYSLYFDGGGREVRNSNGRFDAEETTEFSVYVDDIALANANEGPSPSLMPSVDRAPSMAPTRMIRLIPERVKSVSTLTRNVPQAGSVTAHGIIFDIQTHPEISLTVVGMDILVDATYSLDYEIWSKAGSWQIDGNYSSSNVSDSGESADQDYLAGFVPVANGTVDGAGTSRLTVIPLEDFRDITLERGARQAFWITLKESSLLFQNYNSDGNDGNFTLMSFPDFEVFYGSAVMDYPLGPTTEIRDRKGFWGKIYYTISVSTETSLESTLLLDTPSLEPSHSPQPRATPKPTPIPRPCNTSKPIGNFTGEYTDEFGKLQRQTMNRSSSFCNGVSSLAIMSEASPSVSEISGTPSPTASLNASSIPTFSSPPTFNNSLYNSSLFTNIVANATSHQNITSSSDSNGILYFPTSSPTTFNPVFTYAKSLLIQGVHGSSQFGVSTAISEDGSLLAVGATSARDGMGKVTGAVYLYSLDVFMGSGEASAAPEPFQILYGDSPKSEFGNAVALSRNGSRLVVGAWAENNETGAVRIYDIDGNQVTNTAGFGGQSPSDRVGFSVAISGDGSVVALGATKGGSSDGGYVMTYQAPDWTSFGSVVQGKKGDLAGFSLALSYYGTIMAVGSVKASRSFQWRNEGKGAVYTMGKSSKWKLRDEVYGLEKQVLAGTSIGISGDGRVLVVGSKGYSGASKQQAGRCIIYELVGERKYKILHTMLGQTKKEELGYSATISNDGNTIACGGITGRWSEKISAESGVVRLWNRLASQEKAAWPPGDSLSVVDDAYFGSAVSFSSGGKTIVVGASMWRGTGAVHIFRY